MPLCAAARALRKTRGSSTTSVFEDPLGVETGRGKAKTDGDYANACSAHTAGDIRSLTCFLPPDVTQGDRSESSRPDRSRGERGGRREERGQEGRRRGVRRHRRGREEGRRGQSPRLREVQGEGQPGAPGPQPELGRDDRDRGVAQAWLQSGETGEGRPRRLTLAGKGMTRRAG